MKRTPNILTQMLVLVVLGTLLGFGGNALRDGKHHIKPMHNYFARANPVLPKPAKDSGPESADPNAAAPAGDPNSVAGNNGQPPETTQTAERDEPEWIGEFRVIDFGEALRLHEDPRRQYRAIVFVDARDDSHFLEAHIPGAVQVYPYNTEYYMERALPILMAAETVIVYCTSADCDDSALAAQELRHYGVAAEIVIYKDGWEDWVAKGGPTESGEWQ